MKTGSPEWRAIIKDGAQAFSVNIDDQRINRISKYSLELLRWNRKVNLTRITDPFEFAVKHIIDSIAVSGLLTSCATMIDIGSGAGFPGIVLKIIFPHLFVTLVDASRKRVNFLKHTIRTIGLEDIEAIHARAEDLSKDTKYTKKFDIAVCRAFSKLENFYQSANPFLGEGGKLIAMKGKYVTNEINALNDFIKKQGSSMEAGKEKIYIDLHEYKMPFIGDSRSIVVIGFKP